MIGQGQAPASRGLVMGSHPFKTEGDTADFTVLGPGKGLRASILLVAGMGVVQP